MRVRCLTNRPTEAQVRRLGSAFKPGKTEFVVEPGHEYTVLGLSFRQGEPWFELHVPIRVIASFPALLFEIVDTTVSRYWQIRIDEDGTVRLWPPQFYQEYFIDDFSNGKADVVEELATIEARIEAGASVAS
jgi:hypothetical protein